jgi:hypothetical protein
MAMTNNDKRFFTVIMQKVDDDKKNLNNFF